MYVSMAVCSSVAVGLLGWCALKTLRMWRSYKQDVTIDETTEETTDDNTVSEANSTSSDNRVDALERSLDLLRQRVDMLESHMNTQVQETPILNDDDMSDLSATGEDNVSPKSATIDLIVSPKLSPTRVSLSYDDVVNTAMTPLPSGGAEIRNAPAQYVDILEHTSFMPSAEDVPAGHFMGLGGIESERSYVKRRLEKRGIVDDSITTFEQYARVIHKQQSMGQTVESTNQAKKTKML